MSQSKKTLVLGASSKADRYSHLAVLSLLKKGHEVLAIGNKEGTIETVSIQTGTPVFEQIDTITLYLNPVNQKTYYDYLLSLHPKRIIFNPGTENEELKRKAEAAGITCQYACTLVLLSTGQY